MRKNVTGVTVMCYGAVLQGVTGCVIGRTPTRS